MRFALTNRFLCWCAVLGFGAVLGCSDAASSDAATGEAASTAAGLDDQLNAKTGPPSAVTVDPDEEKKFRDFVCTLEADKCDGTAPPAQDTPSQPFADRISGAHAVVNGEIWAQTRVVFHADVQAVVDALLGDWGEWWHDVALEPLPKTPDLGALGSVFNFSPFSHPFAFTHVKIAVKSPVFETSTKTTVIDMDFSGDFVGPAAFRIQPTADGCVMRALWYGLKGSRFFVPNWLAADLHVWAEAGTLPFPLPKGTGYPGLVAFVENGGK